MTQMMTAEHHAEEAPTAGEPLDLIAELTEDLADRGTRAAAVPAGSGAVSGADLAVAGRLLRAVDRVIAAVVTVLIRVDRAEVIAAEGLTTESWLRAMAGRTGADAGMLLAAAERLADMPATLTAFQAGVLSWGTVRGMVAATRSLTAEQRSWLDQTVAGDRERLTRIDADTVIADAEHAAAQVRPDLERDRAERAASGQRLVLQPNLDGGGSAFAALDAETFTALQTAIESITHDAHGRRVASNVEALRALARQRLRRTGADDHTGASDHTHASDHTGDAPAPDAGATRGAGVTSDAHAAAGSDDDTTAPGHADARGSDAQLGGAPSTARPEIIVVTDLSLLLDPLEDIDRRGVSNALLERTREAARVLWRQDRPAPRLTPAAAQRLACDATLRPVLMDGTRVLGTAEPYARVSAPLRAALIARDGGCRFTGCHRPVDVCEAHHIQHRIDGGPTELRNLALLCGAHHRAVHEGGWKPVLHDDASMTFSRRGTVLHSLPRCAGARPGNTEPPPPGRPRRTRAHAASRHQAAGAAGRTADPLTGAASDARPPRSPDPKPPGTGPLPF